jgi:hypothetical protein
VCRTTSRQRLDLVVLSGEVVMDVTVPSDAGGAVRTHDTLPPLHQYRRATVGHWSNRNPVQPHLQMPSIMLTQI